MNKFVIITTCYNVEKWVGINFYTTLHQSFENFLCVYVDDKSTDQTFENLKFLCEKDDRFHVIQNPNNGGQSKAYMFAYDYINKNNLVDDEDIIVEVDGDDWLSSVFVLDYLNSVYRSGNYWMTYGQYQIFPSMEIGGHYNMEISNDCDIKNRYRELPFPYSHLKTYKKFLLDRVSINDLIDRSTGEYFRFAWDHVLCLPMVEMSGKDRIYRCDDILYVLNRSSELQNEGTVNVEQQKRCEQSVRQFPKYNKLLR